MCQFKDLFWNIKVNDWKSQCELCDKYMMTWTFKVYVQSTQDVDIWMEIYIQHDVYIWSKYFVSSYLNFIPIFWNVLIWLKYDYACLYARYKWPYLGC
jgi:hypothetical protein